MPGVDRKNITTSHQIQAANRQRSSRKNNASPPSLPNRSHPSVPTYAPVTLRTGHPPTRNPDLLKYVFDGLQIYIKNMSCDLVNLLQLFFGRRLQMDCPMNVSVRLFRLQTQSWT